MKKFPAVLLSLTLAGSLCLPVLAAPVTSDPSETDTSGYTLQVNGSDTDIDVCVMVPLRALAEQLGFTVTWSGNQVHVDTGAVHTDVIIGVDRYVITTSLEDMVGMSAPFSLGCPPYAANGVTYVPLSLFDALLGGGENVITGDTGVISIQTGSSAQIPNPFTACATLTEAEEQAGFPLSLPADSTISSLSVIPGELIQADCGNGLSIRKAAGSADISGDYTAYPETEAASVGETTVTLKGSDGKVKVAVWTSDGYTYAIRSETGMSRQAALTLAAQVA